MISLNNEIINITKFPDGTSQIWKLPEGPLTYDAAFITWKFEHEAEVIYLCQLKQLLDKYITKCSLKIIYLPYARQDKKVDNYSTFALHTFSKILNSLNFTEIEIVDPHSEVATELIKKSHATFPVEEVLNTIDILGNGTLVCYPDKGAKDKYLKIYQNISYIYCDKVRDQLTGEIKNISVTGDVTNKKLLIVDDICDGGATFKILASDLLAKGASEVNLFVTYGLFSKGTKTLFDSGINRIFTRDGEVSNRFLTKHS